MMVLPKSFRCPMAQALSGLSSRASKQIPAGNLLRSTFIGLENELVIARDELDALHDDLYVLACAVDDAEADLKSAGARPAVRELQLVIGNLLAAANPLRNRELSAPEVPPDITS